MNLSVPVLESARLRFRAHRREDFPASVAMWADPLVTRYIGNTPFTREQTWARYLRYAGVWAWFGFGMWLAEEKSTGAFVGEFGFFDSKREMEPSIEGFPEVGWVLAPSAWGKGLASEGLQAVLDWGDVHLPARRTVCIIDPEHAASLRVAAKCGFKKVVPTTYAGRPTVLHERWAP